jgi:hypothetical protein
MSDSLARYREMQRDLVRLRRRHHGAESPEEDELLERMDEVWWTLTPSEREVLRAEGPFVPPEPREQAITPFVHAWSTVTR